MDIVYREKSVSPKLALDIAHTMQNAIAYILRVDDVKSINIKAPEISIENSSARKIELARLTYDEISPGNNESDAAAEEFYKYLTKVSKVAAEDFWRSQLDGHEMAVFPSLPANINQPRMEVFHEVTNLQWPDTGPRASTRVHAAWAILQAAYTDTSSAIFGVVLASSSKLQSKESAAGFPGAVVPLCVSVEQDSNSDELLQRLQAQIEEMMPFRQTGLQQIRRISADAKRACQFQTLLIVQPGNRDTEQNVVQSKQTDEDYDGRAQGSTNAFDSSLVIECEPYRQGMAIRMNFDSVAVGAEQAKKLALQLDRVLRQLCADPKEMLRLGDICLVSELDLQEIWSWNAMVPETADVCVHDLIAETVQEQPDAPAVCAWDGELTYAELDALSTQLAHCLVEVGAKSGYILPLCFEKSMWMPIAMLGVMKAGAASVALDSALPENHLRTIIRQVHGDIILSSTKTENLACRLKNNATTVVVLDRLLTVSGPGDRQLPLPKVCPSSLLYVVFTSGSTGTPKGTIITHRNFSSAIRHQLAAFGLDRKSRVYDFASHAFDVAWANVLFTLRGGGCICVPSNSQRQNNLSASIRHFEANVLDLTPTVAREVNVEATTHLRSVTLSGERALQQDVRRWPKNIRILNVYGPAECTVTSTIAEIFPDKVDDVPSIGRGVGLNTWVVARDANKLVPIGAVGELWLEGPLVGHGYLNDQEKTKANFIKDPAWLFRGFGHIRKGSRGRFYRTGDFVQYNADGNLVFIERKDSQIKIRGQRVELGEIEHHVQIALGQVGMSATIVIAELITPRGGNDPVLVAFVNVVDRTDHVTLTSGQTRRLLEEKLKKQIPAYMIPAAYIPVDKMPLTTTGKTDRRTLREMGKSLTRKQLATRGERHPPRTETEKQLQHLWARILNINANRISADDYFLHLGGDSIQAMRLVGAAREEGLFITVADVFRQPRLCDMAKLLLVPTSIITSSSSPVKFSSLNFEDPDRFIQQEVLPQLGGVEHGSISDILSLAPYQASAVEQALETPPGQLYHFYMNFPSSIQTSRLKLCCAKLVDQFDILRTVFIRSRGQLWQVILNKLDIPFDCYETEDARMDSTFEQLCDQDLKIPQRLGRSFLGFAMLKNFQSTRLVFRLSHAQYDGISLSQMVNAFGAFYREEQIWSNPSSSFASFIEFSRSRKQQALDYWRSFLKDSSVTTIPATSAGLAANKHSAANDQAAITLKSYLPALKKHPGITPAAIFTAACADMLHTITGSTDILFGRLVSGRAGLPADLQDVVGCCINVVPVRVRFSPSGDQEDRGKEDIVTSVQNQYLQGIPYETVDYQEEPWSGGVFGCTTQFQSINEQHLETEIEESCSIELQNKEGGKVRSPRGNSVFIVGEPEGNGLRIQMAANPKYHGHDTLTNILTELSRSLSRVVRH